MEAKLFSVTVIYIASALDSGDPVFYPVNWKGHLVDDQATDLQEQWRKEYSHDYYKVVKEEQPICCSVCGQPSFICGCDLF